LIKQQKRVGSLIPLDELTEKGGGFLRQIPELSQESRTSSGNINVKGRRKKYVQETHF